MRQQLAQQQQGAPMFSAGGEAAGGPPRPPGMESIFRPTERPNENPAAMQQLRHSGLPSHLQKVLPVDPQATLRAIYAAYPHPDIAALIRDDDVV
jgi:hypothetical protein